MFQHLLNERPLDKDAEKLPTLDEVRTLWAQAVRRPIPDYDAIAIQRMFRRPPVG